jgi:hypothetical protein
MRKLSMILPALALLAAAPAWAQQQPEQGGEEGPPPAPTVVHVIVQGPNINAAADALKKRVDEVGQAFGLDFDHYGALKLSYPAGSVAIEADAVMVPSEGEQEGAAPAPTPAPAPAPPTVRPPGAR